MEAGIDKTGAFYKVINTNDYCHALVYYDIELTEMNKQIKKKIILRAKVYKSRLSQWWNMLCIGPNNM